MVPGLINIHTQPLATKDVLDYLNDFCVKEFHSLSSFSSEAEFTVDVKTSSEEKTSKRKSEESLERASKRSRGSPSAGPSHRVCSSEGPSTSSSSNSVPSNNLDAFEAKYSLQEMLGQGSYGSVFAGCHKRNPPVHSYPYMLLDGNITMVPLEVALLLSLKPAESETSAVVTLLDWFDLRDVLILILERPDPSMDLFDYIHSRQDPMKEHKAKIITRQLVDALIEIHSKGVFHGDIKSDNILIETGSDVPRVRIIDFGCGAFLSDATHIQRRVFLGSPPERWRNETLRPEPTTVWRLGLVLFEMLHRCYPFQTSFAIMNIDVIMNNSLSYDYQNFILSCLMKNPDARPTFAMLKDHPWLM
ncbi:serine/threonine-protein kinase pim-1 [Larimichthys crocea]|uniref:serine/threonine-protein kinase pim-1 n=1 Tax=Larimichthys crocea TaxID=215358 RepID=UPI000F5DE2CD|nr:serine/threonine-protein kinase pim-1 [Larimichthys crocea]